MFIRDGVLVLVGDDEKNEGRGDRAREGRGGGRKQTAHVANVRKKTQQLESRLSRDSRIGKEFQ
jgi:hypothetical protein